MAEQADTTPAAAAADASPAADALAPDPEGARAVFEEQMARAAKREADEAEQKKKDAAKATAAEFRQRLKDRRAEGKEAIATGAGKELEQAEKEASVPGSDPRESFFDAAPGKSLDDVIERNEARARGEFGDAPAEPKRKQWFVVTDEADLIEVARKLGLPDHGELGAINGRYNSVYGVQPGERFILPAQYTFVDIDGVVTEGDEVATEEPAA